MEHMHHGNKTTQALRIIGIAEFAPDPYVFG
jgi:hypothetical protein